MNEFRIIAIFFCIISSLTSNAKNECDKYLDNYEQKVNSYIELVNKSKDNSVHNRLTTNALKLEKEILKLDLQLDSISAYGSIDTVRYHALVKRMESNYITIKGAKQFWIKLKGKPHIDKATENFLIAQKINKLKSDITIGTIAIDRKNEKAFIVIKVPTSNEFIFRKIRKVISKSPDLALWEERSVAMNE